MPRLRYYRQHTMETCGIACMLMILDAFRCIRFPRRKDEMELYSVYRNQAEPGVSAAAVAYGLSRRGLQTELVCSSPDMMDNRDGYYPLDQYDALLREFRSWTDREDSTFSVRRGEVTCEALRRELDHGRLVMLMVYIEGDADGVHDHCTHAVVVYGYTDTGFRICDPLSGKMTMEDSQLEAMMDSPIGRMFVSAWRPDSPPEP